MVGEFRCSRARSIRLRRCLPFAMRRSSLGIQVDGHNCRKYFQQLPTHRDRRIFDSYVAQTLIPLSHKRILQAKPARELGSLLDKGS